MCVPVYLCSPYIIFLTRLYKLSNILSKYNCLWTYTLTVRNWANCLIRFKCEGLTLRRTSREGEGSQRQCDWTNSGNCSSWLEKETGGRKHNNHLSGMSLRRPGNRSFHFPDYTVHDDIRGLIYRLCPAIKVCHCWGNHQLTDITAPIRWLSGQINPGSNQPNQVCYLLIISQVFLFCRFVRVWL